MLRAVVPLMRSERLAVGAFGVVGELVALALGEPFRAFLRLAARDFPSLAAVVQPLMHLPDPSAGLRGVDAVRVRRRTFHVVALPAGKVRAADLPFVALAVRG